MWQKLGMYATVGLGILFLAGWAMPRGGSAQTSSDNPPAAGAEQNKQLDQLQQMEARLDKDRATVHEAIGKYGFDSDQVDAARQQLIRDRAQYRELRRSLLAAGVTVPPASGMGPGRDGAARGRMGMRGRGMRRGGQCGCPCWGN